MCICVYYCKYCIKLDFFILERSVTFHYIEKLHIVDVVAYVVKSHCGLYTK